MYKVNTKGFDVRIDKLQGLPADAMKKALPVTKSNTPIREGNARRRTTLTNRNTTIHSNYPYAGRLDDGWSRQSPRGYTEPTIKFLRNIVSKLAGKI